MSQKKNVFKLHIWLVRPQLFSHKVEIIQPVTTDPIPSEIDFAQDPLVAVVGVVVGQTLRSTSVYIPKVLVRRLHISALTFLSVHNLLIINFLSINLIGCHIYMDRKVKPDFPLL